MYSAGADRERKKEEGKRIKGWRFAFGKTW